MPEGPEVAIVAEQLHAEYAGKQLTDISHDGKLKGVQIEKCTLPCKIAYITSVGKALYIVFQDRSALHFGLGMEGRFIFEKSAHTHITLTFKQAPVLYFEDMRRFAFMYYVPNWKEDAKALGFDLLHEEVDEKVWCKHMRKYGKKRIGSALLDQSIIAGIGNYLRSEILFYARISPWKKMQELDDTQLTVLYAAAVHIIRKSHEEGGCTLRSYIAPDGQKGKYVPLVYGKKDKHITREKMDGRTIYWDAAIQK